MSWEKYQYINSCTIFHRFCWNIDDSNLASLECNKMKQGTNKKVCRRCCTHVGFAQGRKTTSRCSIMDLWLAKYTPWLFHRVETFLSSSISRDVLLAPRDLLFFFHTFLLSPRLLFAKKNDEHNLQWFTVDYDNLLNSEGTSAIILVEKTSRRCFDISLKICVCLRFQL